MDNLLVFFGVSLGITTFLGVVDFLNTNPTRYKFRKAKVYQSSDLFEIHMIGDPLSKLDENEVIALKRVLNHYDKNFELDNKYIQFNIHGKSIDFVLMGNKNLNIQKHEQLIFTVV